VRTVRLWDSLCRGGTEDSSNARFATPAPNVGAGHARPAVHEAAQCAPNARTARPDHQVMADGVRHHKKQQHASVPCARPRNRGYGSGCIGARRRNPPPASPALGTSSARARRRTTPRRPVPRPGPAAQLQARQAITVQQVLLKSPTAGRLPSHGDAIERDAADSVQQQPDASSVSARNPAPERSAAGTQPGCACGNQALPLLLGATSGRPAAAPESAPTPPGDGSANSRYRPGSGRKPLSAPKWRVCVLYVPTSHFQLYDIVPDSCVSDIGKKS